MKVTQEDLDRFGLPVADDVCRRLHDAAGNRFDQVTVHLFVDDIAKHVRMAASSCIADPDIPPLPYMLDLSPEDTVTALAIGFAPVVDEPETEASFLRHTNTTAVFPFLKKKTSVTVEEFVRLSVLEWLSCWVFCYWPPAPDGGAFGKEGMRRANAGNRAVRWAQEGLPEVIAPVGQKVKPTGHLSRRALLCGCYESHLWTDAKPGHALTCTGVRVPMRSSAAMDPAELRRRTAPTVRRLLFERYPRLLVRDPRLWAEWGNKLDVEYVPPKAAGFRVGSAA